MKRTFKSLLAAAGLAFIGLGAASPAFAVPTNGVPVIQNGITCVPRINGNYPENGHINRCGTATAAKLGQMVTATQGLAVTAPNALTQLTNFHTQAPQQIYLFGTQAEYNTFFGAQPHPQPSSVNSVGLSSYTAGGIPVFIAVFETVPAGVPDVRNTTIHELGHHLDYLYRVQSGIANPTDQTRYSDGVLVKDQVYFDKQKIDLLTPCNATATGYFNGRKDANLAWICTTNGTGATLSASYVNRFNKQILEIAQDYYFDTTVVNRRYKELFAETFANVTNNPDPNAPEAVNPYFQGNSFACTRKAVDVLVKTGVPATAADLESVGCYKRPTTTFAGCSLYTKAGFPFPYLSSSAQFVYCGNTPASYRERAGDKWMNLPNANPSTSLMRQRFETQNISLYVFPTADIAKAQMGAALPASVLNPGVISYTQLNVVAPARTRFIVLFEQVKQPNGTYLATNTTLFSAYHNQENGRVVDFLFGGFASDSSVFKTYYQKDFTNYNNVTLNPPCVLYSAQNICSGGVPAGVYAGKTNFQILLMLFPQMSTYVKDPATYAVGSYRDAFAEEFAIKAGGGIDASVIDLWL
ncbi:MAG TPA: hypothetical protein PK317_03260, partial [Coprothermobacter proteolyticus]|nr:hypothetical protein [Coprothermobacter proteolyticus]